MWRLGRVVALVGVAALLSSCSRAIDLRVGNPCDHPLLVVTSYSDAADLEQRDRVALRGSWLQWALVPAGGEAVVGSVSDAAGIDDIHTVWVDEADFRTTITYEQVENADGSLWLADEACAEPDPPKTLALVDVGDDRHPSIIDVAGPTNVITEYLATARLYSGVGIDATRTTDQSARINYEPEYGGDVPILAALVGQTPPARQHICDKTGCATTDFAPDQPPPLDLPARERPPAVLVAMTTIVLIGLAIDLPIYLLVRRRRRRKTKVESG